MIKIIALCVILLGIMTYPKWSYKEYYKRCEINSKHPLWKPFCGTNFIQRDKKWFIDNGYLNKNGEIKRK